MKKRKVDHACVYCRRSHMTCDNDRPCGRCVRRNIGHLCHDEPRRAPSFQEQVGSEFDSIAEFLNFFDASEVDSSLSEASATERFMLTAADPEHVSPEGRLKQVIDAKVRAGLLKPFDYVGGYDRLKEYMDRYMVDSSQQRILKSLAKFRPGFRAVAKSLEDVDLIMVEEYFERMLLEYDRVFSSVAMPACLWRRTGEIYRGNKEFAELIDVPVEDLRDGKLAIYQLMGEDSTVNYWEKYGSIAFNSDQKAVVTTCTLKTLHGRKRHQCCFSFTIIRDKYNIPSCIVGNFIPTGR